MVCDWFLDFVGCFDAGSGLGVCVCYSVGLGLGGCVWGV